MAKAAANHALMVTFPGQGHIIPSLELVRILAGHHIRVTFASANSIDDPDASPIRFVSFRDGWDPTAGDDFEEDVMGIRRLTRKMEELIREVNEEEKVSCLVYDILYGRNMQQIAENIGIPSATFSIFPAALAALAFHIPKLVDDGVIDNQGTPLKEEPLQLAPKMPIMKLLESPWMTKIEERFHKGHFEHFRIQMNPINNGDWFLFNSCYDLEEGAFTLAPKVVPIGPLVARNRHSGNSTGHYWKQDTDCLEWLDQQSPCSVIYVSFGSTTMLSDTELQELALGLERSNRPFLWVVRSGIHMTDGFVGRVTGRGRIVGWAPQREVLSHPSTACFVTHCGWNSVMESVSNGVPMLCWPYFAEHYFNQSYICDIWRVGFRLDITSDKVKQKIDLLLGDDGIKERALQLKNMVLSSSREGGNSYENLQNFINWIKGM